MFESFGFSDWTQNHKVISISKWREISAFSKDESFTKLYLISDIKAKVHQGDWLLEFGR